MLLERVFGILALSDSQVAPPSSVFRSTEESPAHKISYTREIRAEQSKVESRSLECGV